MGWSDVALCLSGPVVQDLRTHFSQRWNFIYDEKYGKKDTRYARLSDTGSGDQQRGFGGGQEGERGLFGPGGGLGQKIFSKVNQQYHEFEHQYGHEEGAGQQSHAEHSAQQGGVDAQITRSSAKWSHNITTEV